MDAFKTFGEKNVAKQVRAKENSGDNSQIEQAGSVIKQYLESNNRNFVPVPGGFAVLNRTTQLPPLNEQLIGACFQAFLLSKGTNCSQSDVNEYLAFIKLAREKGQTTSTVVKFQTGKPIGAFFQDMKSN